MLSVGLDAHHGYYAICVRDATGRIVKETTVRGSSSQLLGQLGRLGEPFAICFEASCSYGHLHDRLAKIAHRVVVAHPGRLRLIFQSKRKTDRVDAQKLSLLLMLNEVPQVYVPSIDVRAWRRLIEFRSRQVSERTRAKNTMRAMLRSFDIRAPRGLWSGKGMRWLAELEVPTRTAAIERDLTVDRIRQLNDHVKRLEGELGRIASQHSGVMLLQTIPGVGPRTAEAVMAYIDNPRRFERTKAIGRYFGLVPCQDESAGKARFGHVTREGPRTVRRMLTEAAWQAKRRSPELAAYFDQVQRGDPARKKIALVALGHRMARIMLSMLKTGETWQGARMRAA